MKSTSKNELKPAAHRESPRREYRFDYTRARPNRFAGSGGTKAVVVLLDPDVAKVFHSAESVNSALRAILAAVPAGRGSRRATTPPCPSA